MKKMFLTATAVTVLSVFIGLISAVTAASAPGSVINPVPLISLSAHEAKNPPYVLPTVYRHGDCTWIPPVALAAGWRQKQIPHLMHIIARESGCCPTRIGGSVVDKNCQITRMATMSHPSDSGLLQINGVHWKQDHKQYAGLVCKQMKICTQEPLLDAFTNLKAGRLLFDVAGWSPWRVN
jgi:hypothetical protein